LHTLNAGFKRWATSPDGPHRLLIPIKNDNSTLLNQAIETAQRAPKIDFRNHTIAQGDSLSGIAKQYGVSVSALKSNNNLHNANIRAGKTLLIPLASSSSNQMIRTIKPKAKQNSVHHVQKGDTLWSIARQYKVQVSNLLSWNNISKNQVLRLNQTLLIRVN